MCVCVCRMLVVIPIGCKGVMCVVILVMCVSSDCVGVPSYRDRRWRFRTCDVQGEAVVYLSVGIQ